MDIITAKFLKFVGLLLALVLLFGVTGLFVELWPLQLVVTLAAAVLTLAYAAWLNIRYR